ncbi:alpha-galactosidase [Dictyobacter kobayashii]|uniref:Alpha-galactosidase n=1 Tax=Dictyobacter kobayashii TaxID=2014872 RepID=A0A402AV45_9CHLR|nr:alpha-galactosidase [Dictyobacter kobayashii]GCE22883.1 alpha-galactosidase [Dictyobacter kobayashii]
MQTDKITGEIATGIHQQAGNKSWLLVTEHSSYALGVTEEGLLLQLYWGARLPSFNDLPSVQLPAERSSQDVTLTLAREEYPALGGLRYGEFAAQAVFADGTRDIDLRFEGAEIGERQGLPELRLRLRDAVYPLDVILSYRVDSKNDLIIRSASFHNKGDEAILLERAFSAVWHLPAQFTPRHLTTLAGHWGGETRIQRQPVVAGTVQIESRKGVTGSNAYPWFAIDTQATEQLSEVYFGTIAWSGSWNLRVSTRITGETAIAGGIHDHDFAWTLAGQQSFETPDFVAGFAQDGINGSRHRLHRYIREHVLPQPQASQPRPVLYNSWEATFFDVTEEGQSKLAERAAELGVELFVVDDGWFPARNHDHAGLGDWRIDPQKFPNGLQPLVNRVNELGMQFGIWVEPEMVNPDSDLYRAHPDWIYHFPNRPRSEARNQLVLNVGRQDVQEYLITVLDKLIGDHNVSFIKWDMNRPISEPGWPEYVAAGNNGREVWVRHVEGVYTIMDTLRARHPNLSIESCSSGGSRADLGILERTDQVWSSDNTHPDARLFIQEGISHILPGRVMGDWVTDTPSDRVWNEIPLSYRFHVAMMGMLGIGGHLMHWSKEDLAEAKRWIAVYKQIRPIVQDGEQSWLISPTATEGNWAAVESLTTDASEAVVFAFRRTNPFWEVAPRLRLQGLQPTARYSVQSLGQTDNETQEYSGAALMNQGIALPLGRSSYASCILHLRLINR